MWMTYSIFIVLEGQHSVCVNAARYLSFVILNSKEFSAVFCFPVVRSLFSLAPASCGKGAVFLPFYVNCINLPISV